MNIQEIISKAEEILPCTRLSGDKLDPRWQIIIQLSEYIESNPDEIWEFIKRWGQNEDDDLRTAISTCLLEHLLEHHFEKYFSEVEQLVKQSELFADTFSMCWKFGQSDNPENAKRFEALKKLINSE